MQISDEKSVLSLLGEATGSSGEVLRHAQDDNVQVTARQGQVSGLGAKEQCAGVGPKHLGHPGDSMHSLPHCSPLLLQTEAGQSGPPWGQLHGDLNGLLKLD